MAIFLVNSGSRGGKAFPLENDLVKIGRHRDNHLVLSEKTISRFHAEVVRKGDRFFLRDLGSTHGTFVNNTPVNGDQPLQDSDQVRIGDVHLTFQDGEKPAAKSAGLPMASDTDRTLLEDTSPVLDERTIAFSMPSVPDAEDKELSSHRMDLLSKVAEAIQSVADLEDLLGTLMDVLFEIFHPDRGVIFLREGENGELVRKVALPKGKSFKVSSTIVNHAVKNQMALLVADTAGDDRFSDALSIQSQSIQAAICCPLICKERVLGVLYLDTQVNLFAYKEEDLGLLNIIAANAAMAIENAILIQEKLDTQRLSADELGPLIAESTAMEEVKKRIEKLAALDSGAVLITGEVGTGKFSPPRRFTRRRAT